MGTISRSAFIAGIVTAVVALSLLVILQQREEPLLEDSNAFLQSPINGKEGFSPTTNPLASGPKIDMEEAKRRTPWAMPLVAADESVGQRVGTWIDPQGQVAVTWDSKLRMYAEKNQVPQEELVRIWTTKAGSADEDSELVEVHGHPALLTAHPGGGGSIIFVEHGVAVTIISEEQSPTELKSIADSVTYEE